MNTGAQSNNYEFNEPRARFADADPRTRELLDDVLQKTTEFLKQQPDAELLSGMLTIAKRYQGQPLTLEPILVDLVDSVLAVQFPVGTIPEKLRPKMVKRISETLFDDPTCQSRVLQMWDQLMQAVQE